LRGFRDVLRGFRDVLRGFRDAKRLHLLLSAGLRRGPLYTYIPILRRRDF
jgi:hypothetical protein